MLNGKPLFSYVATFFHGIISISVICMPYYPAYMYLS